MFRRVFFMMILLCGTGICCFGQTGLLRDYVGLINQTFHPGIVAYMEKFKGDLERRGDADAARSIDNYLKGGSGSGFVYVAPDGNNYIITNYHVITQSYTLSVTFEKQDGTKTVYEGLDIVAADEDMDIALLSFPEGNKPFAAGLAFLDRPVDEGEDVYSAGFPGLGITPLWQFGRGMVSNAQVRFPAGDNADKIMGPYIQHTAQVDPGNSGGPLLAQTPGVPAGYAVVGINTLSARFRQAANFSIPVDRVRSFLDAALDPAPVDERSLLDARINSFIEGLGASKTVYEHIARYLSNACTGENAEFAIYELQRKAPRKVVDDIVQAFSYSPVDGMNYAVAWTIENFLRSKSGGISITVDDVVPDGENGFAVTFKANDKNVVSGWIREYGIWRINTFGDFAAGDKTLIEKREQEKKDEGRLKTDINFQASGGLAWVFDRGAAFGGDVKIRFGNFGLGLRVYTRGLDFTQIEALGGVYFPVRINNKLGFTPYGDLGLGFMIKKDIRPVNYLGLDFSDDIPDLDFGLSLQGGLMFTTSAVPGLFLQAAYQYNAYLGNFSDDIKSDPHIFLVGIGYGF
jgi:serine protease Do